VRSYVTPGKRVPLRVSNREVVPARPGLRYTADNRLAFDDDVAVANRDPYGDGWLIRLQPSDFEGESGHLVDGAAAFEHYRKIIEEEGIRCFRCEE